MQCLPWPQNHPLFFFYLSAVCPRLAAPFFSVDFLFLCSCLLPFRRRLSTMLPTEFASKPYLSPPSGLEGLRRNITAIGSTPPPPEAGTSLGHASVLAQGMRECLLSKFSGQASGKWVVRLSCLLIAANARGLQGRGRWTPLPWHAQISLELNI